MLKKQKNWQVLNSLKDWIKKNKVLDIYIFGSFTRGNLNPKDIDLCVLIKDEDEKKSIDLVNNLSKELSLLNIPYHINILTEKDFINGNTLTKTLIEEGISILKKKPLNNILGYNANSMFIYSFKKFNNVESVKFHYALKGRYGSLGILKSVNGKMISRGVIIVPLNKEDIFKEFLDLWKLNYNIERILS